ncbi:uncharacterized protein J4E87_001208 [Alternaria ethzedia]|uniref:uncharacterized protein n=1 Tax=Alternaria ethzedia TaxID=181014 RepID=UPI0020C41829|nr:uncharacterized protein J4E87_001208 [Alternaria ethzedia]KAI4634039.1 hypothetical protein J4E87_001208 [Alternaria ethzedia]
MSSTKASLTALALGFSSLFTPAFAAPSPSYNSPKPVKDPYFRDYWPAPRKITGQDLNGTLGGVHIHDPSIVLGPDGHYYSFSSHGLATTSRASKKNSLEGYWEVVAQVLEPPGSIDDPAQANRLWAPDVHKVGDTYYCYYTVSDFGVSESFIGLATSKTLKNGSWTDHGMVVSSNSTDAPFPLSKTNTIDAAFIQDAKTGKSYLSYGSWWANLWQFELTKDLKSVKIPTARQLSYTYDPALPTKEQAYANMSLSWGGASAEEAPYINYNKEQGFYYLWYSAGLCCGYNPAALPPPGAEYTIFVGRSKSPRGPFVDRNGKDLAEGGGSMVYGSHGNTYAPGGQAVISDYRGSDVLYYHYVNTTFDPLYRDNFKFLGWNPIKYVKGWPVLQK